MKKIILVFALFFSIMSTTFAEETEKSNVMIYTFFFNVVGERFRLPLLGFINIAGGNHNAPQIGFVNLNQGNFSTLQLGFVNTVGGNLSGLEVGFVSLALGNVSGVQMSFINTTLGENMNGLQLGFISANRNTFSGAQISFINATKELNGLQFGFINYTDSIKNGIPIGFVSIVKKGGYKAIEAGFSEISPINLSFKIGVEKFYTAFTAGYNPLREGIKEQIIHGAGFGSITNIGNKFFLNPEIMSYSDIDGDFRCISFTPNFGYKIKSNFSIIAGPSIAWVYPHNNETQEPFINNLKYEINEKHNLYFGGRIAARFNW